MLVISVHVINIRTVEIWNKKKMQFYFIHEFVMIVLSDFL